MTARLPDLLDAIPPEGIPLEALAHLVNQALDQAQLAVPDKRATETLDGRTIRFYQSLGILPRPEYVGRRAMYGRDHFVRAVAAKQLQSEGYSLAQVQSALPVQSSDELLEALEKTIGKFAAPLSGPARKSAREPSFAASNAHPSDTGRPLMTQEIARGVFVTIDPALVPNPTALLTLLTHTTHQAQAQRANHGGEI